MFREKILERPSYRTSVGRTLTKENDTEPDKYILSEWRLAFWGLIIALITIAAKVYHLNRNYLHSIFLDKKLVSLEEVTNDGAIMFRNVWVEYVKYSNYWLPILCGLLSTYFTWLMVYLDSNVPGVQPPSPLSPNKYKVQSGHVFHLNYIFALLVGILVTSYMFWEGISL